MLHATEYKIHTKNNTIFNNVQQLQFDVAASISVLYHLGWRLGLRSANGVCL